MAATAGMRGEASSGTGKSRLKTLGGVLAVIVPVILWFAPLSLDDTVQHALAITVFMILSWITEALDASLTGIIGSFLFWALGVAPFNIAFGGFATDTPWFLFGAILFGSMATKSGLARRIAFLIMRQLGNNYAGVLLGLIISDFFLT